MKNLISTSVIVCLCFIFSTPTFAESYTKFLKDGDTEFNDRARQNEKWREGKRKRDAEKAALRAAERDKSNDFCFAIDNQDAQNACLGEPYRVSNLRAQNILLGHCHAFDTNNDYTKHLQYICTEGKRGCALLDDSTAAYQCEKCNGTKRWLATYSLGTIIQCWK